MNNRSRPGRSRRGAQPGSSSSPPPAASSQDRSKSQPPGSRRGAPPARPSGRAPEQGQGRPDRRPILRPRPAPAATAPARPQASAKVAPTGKRTGPPPLPPHWREGLNLLLTSPTYQPMDGTALARKLHVPATEAADFAAFLAEEQERGRVMQVRHSLYVEPSRLGFCVGHLQMNERGFGFLVPLDPAHPDFYVAGEDTGTAFHGDLVLSRLKEQRGRGRDSRQRGEVVKVLQRKRRQLVGTLRRSPLLFFVQPDETRIPHDICIPAPPEPAPLGQKVVVELKDWPDRRKPPEGVLTEVLGPPDAPGVDLLSIIRKHDLPVGFPEPVEREAASIPSVIPPEEIARREDFRQLFTLTIDPDDAKDFDDALSYRLLPRGEIEVFIHIADVSHYVPPGSALDTEARERGNSVYLVDRVIPMLPEKLSNGLCSLRPDVDRLVKTAIVTLDAHGAVKSSRFATGIIHSARRFTYQEALGLLRRPPSTPLAEHLHVLNRMAQVLRRNRFAKGALELDFPEVKVRVDALGIPTHLERMENDISHQLIEEFMLLANEVVALELKRRHRPALYRVHETPDPERLGEYRAQVKSMGFPCGDLTLRGEIQKLLARVKGQPGEGAVKIGLLRSLKRAMYSPKSLGHYGLSKINYTHFTSPIRRYSDLVVHRVLFSPMTGRAEFSYDTLSRMALHLSQTERSASEAEQESVKLKKLEYFDRQARATKRVGFQALVLEVRSSGLLVQLPEFLVQGLVPLSGLEGELFNFNPQRLELQGQRSRLLLRAGMEIPVEVARVDLGRQQVDFKITKQALAKLSASAKSTKS